jgi:hypothetical protein
LGIVVFTLHTPHKQTQQLLLYDIAMIVVQFDPIVSNQLHECDSEKGCEDDHRRK